MSYSLELADVNALFHNGHISESERIRRIFAIRDKYESKISDVITDPSTIFDTFERDQEAEDNSK